ncbi:hypothetical protein GCM10027443_29940 [Pontibacter brevis]
MRNIKVLYAIIALFIITGTVVVLLKLGPTLKRFLYEDGLEQRLSEPVLGVYGLPQHFPAAEANRIQHYTLKWEDKGDLTLTEALQSSLSESQPTLLTIEMFARGFSGSYRSKLKAVAKGRFDIKIRQIASIMSKRQRTTYVRWNPEMEVPVKQFPWQNQSPELYIKAFRHFARVWKATAPDTKIVWGPAGYPGALEWWRGEDVVDFTSITLASQSELNTTTYPQEHSVPAMLRRKLHRMRFIDKPLLILGSENLPKHSFNSQWVELASREVQPYRPASYKALSNQSQQKDSPVTPGSVHVKAKSGVAQHFLLGVYDPKLRLTKEKSVSVEHLFTDWPELRNGRFRKKFEGVIARGHQVVVTVEPWLNSRKNDPDVLVNTPRGQYDNELRELYDVVSNAGQTVYLRWAHEMEIPIHRYPWQSQDPIDYIKCFRYFATFRQPRPENIRLVWGPAGDRGSLEWWPGNDVVDYISLAVFGLPDKNITDYRKQETFSTIFKRKFYRMRFVDKPIFITEFGVKGPEEFQKVWLEEAAQTIHNYPEIAGVCYFNQPDEPKAWGEIKVPDWSISKATFAHFSKKLARQQQPTVTLLLGCV